MGEAIGFSLVYSGNFLAHVEVDHFDATRVTMGINSFDFSWNLNGGGSFQTPEAIISFTSTGLNSLSQNFHSLFVKVLRTVLQELKVSNPACHIVIVGGVREVGCGSRDCRRVARSHEFHLGL